MKPKTRSLTGLLLASSLTACATAEPEVTEVDANEAGIMLVGERFDGAEAEFVVIKNVYTATTSYLAFYNTGPEIAYLQRHRAGPGYQFDDQTVASTIDRLFSNIASGEGNDEPPELTWAEKGRVQTTNGTANYQMFDADGTSCVGFTRGWGQPGADNSLDAYLNIVNGYFCTNADIITATDVENLINSVKIQR